MNAFVEFICTVHLLLMFISDRVVKGWQELMNCLFTVVVVRHGPGKLTHGGIPYLLSENIIQ